MLASWFLVCVSLLAQGELLRETLADGTRIEREVAPGPDGRLVNEGVYREFWPKGNPKVEGRYFKGLPHGPWRTWHPGGERAAAGTYKKGLREGDWTAWHRDGTVDASESGAYKVLALEYPDGTPRSIGEARRGLRHGSWTFYWDNGCEKASGRYVDGWLSGPWVFRHPDGTFDPDWISGLYEQGQRMAPLSAEARIEAVSRSPAGTGPRSGSTAWKARQLLSGMRAGEPSRLEETLAELRRSAADPVFLSELLVQLDASTEAEERLAQELWRAHLQPTWDPSDALYRRLWIPAGESASKAERRLERLRWATVARLQSPELLWLRFPMERMDWQRALLSSQASKKPYQPSPLEPIVHLALDDGLPETQAIADSPYRKRLEKRPKGPDREALGRALLWLRDHQSPDGSWDADGFSERCTGPVCDGPGAAEVDVGVTALALLAFLGDGHSSRHGDFRETVARGLCWLIEQQDPQKGHVGELGGSWAYNHAAATMAVCEALVFSEDFYLRRAAERAVACILRARNPHGGWQYSHVPLGKSDTSVTGWMVTALHAARIAQVTADYDPAFDGALAFLDQVTHLASGRVGYMDSGSLSSRLPANEHFPREKGEALTAAGLFCRILLGQRPETFPILAKHAQLIRSKPPVWDTNGFGSDFYYWYYGTHALQLMGKPYWPAWEKAMKQAVVETQRLDKHAAGSWDPICAWSFMGGRVYSTALLALCLEAPRRLALSESR